ncbi:MAG: hypothetical protein IKN50_04820, partial [Clostridia bacterium]|nr:hypothetical protein [Clostridia bacterium]
EKFSAVVRRGENAKIETEIVLPETLNAPINEGDVIGKAVFRTGDQVVGEVPVKALEEVPKITFRVLLEKMLRALVLG